MLMTLYLSWRRRCKQRLRGVIPGYRQLSSHSASPASTSIARLPPTKLIQCALTLTFANHCIRYDTWGGGSRSVWRRGDAKCLVLFLEEYGATCDTAACGGSADRCSLRLPHILTGVNDANIKCIIIATAIGAGATQRRPTRARVHTSTQILLFKSSAAFLLTVSMSAPTNLLII